MEGKMETFRGTCGSECVASGMAEAMPQTRILYTGCVGYDPSADCECEPKESGGVLRALDALEDTARTLAMASEGLEKRLAGVCSPNQEGPEGPADRPCYSCEMVERIRNIDDSVKRRVRNLFSIVERLEL